MALTTSRRSASWRTNAAAPSSSVSCILGRSRISRASRFACCAVLPAAWLASFAYSLGTHRYRIEGFGSRA